MITKTFHSTEYTMNFTMQRRFDLLIRINPVHSVHIREQMLFVWLRTQYSCTEKAKHFLISSSHLVNTSGLSLQQELLLNFFKTLPPTIVPLRRRPDRSILFLRFFRGIRNGMKISSASSYVMLPHKFKLFDLVDILLCSLAFAFDRYDVYGDILYIQRCWLDQTS